MCTWRCRGQLVVSQEVGYSRPLPVVLLLDAGDPDPALLAGVLAVVGQPAVLVREVLAHDEGFTGRSLELTEGDVC